MRHATTFTLALLITLLLTVANSVWAVPVTGGTGPGGIGTTSAGADLAAWFRADQGLFQDTAGTTPATVASDPIGRWSDLSGHNRHATQATAIRRPTLSTGLINSNSGVSMTTNNTADADDQFLDSPNFGLTQATHVFASFKFNGGDTTNPSVFDGLVTGNTMRMYITGGGSNANMYAGGNLTAVIPGSTSIFHNYGFLYDSASSTSRADGTQISTGNAGAVNAGGVRIGGSIFADQDANSDILEMAIFDRALNSAETTIIENYLSARTSVAMTAGNQYSGDDPGNGDYDLDVFGIGNDGSNSLTSSGSEGLGLEETGGTLNSGEFVLAGHKATSNGLTTADMPDDLQRWERVWYVDTNGGSIDATLGFGWSDSGLVSTFDPTFNTLYYSPTDPYSFTKLAGASSKVGDQVFFDLSSLATGYYTLGTGPVPEPSSLLLLGFGLLGFMRQSRRARRRA